MKRIYLSKILLSILFIGIFAQLAYMQEDEAFSINKSPLPKPASPVLDNVGVLDPPTKKRLEDKLINFKEQSNPPVEIAIAIVKTTGDRPIFDYSIAVARGWGIGSREQDNPGALLFIAIEDRKYFTQVSSDLEDELPDGLVGSLQRQYLVPQFKRGNYARGIEDTIEAYIRTIKIKQGDPNAIAENERERQQYNDDSDYSDLIFDCVFIFIVIIVIIIIASSFGGGGGGRGRRGGGGGDSSWLYVPISSGSDWGSSGGSSWGGGSSGGGWGGFGGGGDFGGGGAGGGW